MSSSPCAACKLLRRKCTPECIFAPYFPPDQPYKFANVHRVFGASNVGKLLRELSPEHREEAVVSLAYEAEERLRDRVLGCVGYVYELQYKICQVKREILNARKQLAKYVGPAAFLDQPPLPEFATVPAQHLFQAQPRPVAPFGFNGQPQGQLLMNEQQKQLLLQMGQPLQPAAGVREQGIIMNGFAQYHQFDANPFIGMTGYAVLPERFNCGFAIEQQQPPAVYAGEREH